jgi:hypothetical protein
MRKARGEVSMAMGCTALVNLIIILIIGVVAGLAHRPHREFGDEDGVDLASTQDLGGWPARKNPIVGSFGVCAYASRRCFPRRGCFRSWACLPSSRSRPPRSLLPCRNHFGRSLVLMLLGQIVAAGGATALALWLRKRE